MVVEIHHCDFDIRHDLLVHDSGGDGQSLVTCGIVFYFLTSL